VPKLTGEREAIVHILVHSGRETTWRLSLGAWLVHGDVGVLEELGAVLARPFPDHDSDARVLFDLRPSEGERRGDHAEKALGHLLG